MFEGKPPRPADARAFDEKRDIDPLRPLNWSDLVARLSAARGLRPYGEGPDAAGVEASFDAGSARRIAAHHNGKHDVNPDVSANGIGPAGTDLRAGFGAEPRAMRK